MIIFFSFFRVINSACYNYMPIITCLLKKDNYVIKIKSTNVMGGEINDAMMEK